nr:pseudouridine synthase [uncultured Corynebacterium sp.]
MRTVSRRRRPIPLPIRDGLNPSRVRVPDTGGAVTAGELIAAAVAGQTHRHPDDDADAIAARFADGLVVDAAGRALAPDDVLSPGSDAWFHRRPAPEPTLAGAMPILHRDERLVVVDKPPFLATTPRGRHITETAVVRLRRELGDADLVPAHRLDRLTSGVLVFIADPAARGAYQNLFAEPGAVAKHYEALTAAPGPDAPPPTPMTIATRQDKTRGILQARTVPGEPNARTVVDAIDVRDDGRALWHLRPLTGRTHQLRLHLHELGFPILGDPLYPDVLPDGDDDPAHPMHLLCREISFDDPFTGARRTFRSRRSVDEPDTAP